MPEVGSDWRAMVRRERELLRLTQAQLGRAANLSPESIRKYEGGQRTPTRETLTRILAVLQVPQVRTREILHAAGFAAADGLFPLSRFPDYYFTVAEAREEIAATPWPQFVVGNVMEIVAANAAAQRLWNIDLGAELGTRARPQLHFLALLAEPRFASHITNFDECLATTVAVLKGVPQGGAALGTPGPWVDAVFAQFAANNPSAVAKLLRAWETTPPFRVKAHNTYRVVWREPEGEIRFLCAGSTASEPDGLAFNDWFPADAESHVVLEQVLEQRGGSGVRSKRRGDRKPASGPASPGSSRSRRSFRVDESTDPRGGASSGRTRPAGRLG